MDWKFKQAIPVWWSFLWRTVLYGAAAGALTRIVAYLLAKSGAIDMPEAMILANVAAGISYLPLSLVAMRQSLSRHAWFSGA